MILEANQLSKGFASGEGRLEILRNISISLSPGETVAIMGPSGCGKSTLISCLAGLMRPDAGRIMISGRDLTQMSGDELIKFRAANIGVVFQQFHLVPHLTARENIRLPLDFAQAQDSQERVTQALSRAKLLTRADHLPSQLSRGECQRVAIARVLVMHPSLILADEPTGSLDRTNGSEAVQFLVSAAKDQGAALIMVTHDPQMARHCGRILKFSDGKLSPYSEREIEALNTL